MGKKITWGDESISGGYSDNKEYCYRAKKGEKHVIRAITEPEEYLVHEVDNVAQNKKGEPITFSINCGKSWDEKTEDWVGSCLACDREYDTKPRYVSGILLLGVIKGKTSKPMLIDADHSVLYWDFAGTTYEKFRDVHFNLANAELGAKKVKQVELLVSCGKGKDDEMFQKVNLNVYQGKKLTTTAHAAEFKERGRKLIAEVSAPTTAKEMKRQLKKRKARDDDDNNNDSDDSGRKKRRSKKEAEPEDDFGDDDNDDADAPEENESTGDDEMDALLDEI